METPRISASSYSNTAPLIWSFLYGSQHGSVELILDNAPARSAQLLAQGRVDAALVPVIAYHEIEGVNLVPGVCVGAQHRVRSVCLVTKGSELSDVRSVALDVSSRTSVVLTRILFREFLGFEPEWRQAEPNIESMLKNCDAALLIGDPALSISDRRLRIADSDSHVSEGRMSPAELPVKHNDSKSQIRNPQSAIDESAVGQKSTIRTFDLAQLWRRYTGLGFVFAMWMTRHGHPPVDFSAARDEGLSHIDEIVSNYVSDLRIDAAEFRNYLTQNISYAVDDELERGMRLYFDLAKKHRLCENIRDLRYTQ